jgi:hypothetical protein
MRKESGEHRHVMSFVLWQQISDDSVFGILDDTSG